MPSLPASPSLVVAGNKSQQDSKSHGKRFLEMFDHFSGLCSLQCAGHLFSKKPSKSAFRSSAWHTNWASQLTKGAVQHHQSAHNSTAHGTHLGFAHNLLHSIFILVTGELQIKNVQKTIQISAEGFERLQHHSTSVP